MKTHEIVELDAGVFYIERILANPVIARARTGGELP
jgi:hypothetical protein